MSNRPRWAFIHPFQLRLRRGIETYVWQLSAALAGRDVDVDILTWRGPLPIPEDLPPGVRIITVPASRYYQEHLAVPFYVKSILQGRYDHIFVQFAGYGEGPALRIAGRLANAPFSVVLHFPYDLVPHRYREFVQYGLFDRARRIISVSSYVAEELRQCARKDSVVIHHGVNTGTFRPLPAQRRRVRAALGVAQDAPLALTAAALEERKGVQWVLHALPSILRERPDALYLVLGDGAYRAPLERLVRDLGISGAVRFLGAQEDTTPFYQAADVFCIMSRGEASSLVALESLACGLPVVASDRRPFDELIEPTCGLLVPEEDSPRLARSLVDLLGDPPRRRQMGDAGRARVLSRFTWERAADNYVRCLL